MTFDPMSIPIKLSHLAMPINFLAQRKNQMARVSNSGPLDPYALPLRHTGWAKKAGEVY